jgi:DNA-binding beta-propeller fold protein YncE
VTVVSTGRINNQSLAAAFRSTIPKRDPDDTSDIILESGRFKYKFDNNWAKLPPEIKLSDVPAIATDGEDRVYVFNRGEHPVLIFDRDGNLLDHWGEGVFSNPHGIFVGPDGMIYLADEGDHSVRKCTRDGKVVLTLGTPHKPAPFMSGNPFCRVTDIALSPQGDMYISDGYGNARVHKFSPDGKLLFSWGEPGNGPGQFYLVHNLVCDDAGWVYVTDRENSRVQVFDGNGKFETQWINMTRPNGIDRGKGPEKLFYVGEGGPVGSNRDFPNLGPSLLVLNAEGERIAKIGTLPSGHDADRFLSCHGLAVDSHDDVYLGENSMTQWRFEHPKEEPKQIFPLRKLVRMAS